MTLRTLLLSGLLLAAFAVCHVVGAALLDSAAHGRQFETTATLSGD